MLEVSVVGAVTVGPSGLYEAVSSGGALAGASMMTARVVVVEVRPFWSLATQSVSDRRAKAHENWRNSSRILYFILDHGFRRVAGSGLASLSRSVERGEWLRLGGVDEARVDGNG